MHSWQKTAIILLAVLILAGVILFAPVQSECNWDFQHSVWGPAMLLVNGEPPYQLNPPYGPYVAPWFPQIIGFNFWMGWLPCWLAARLWLAVEMIALGVSIWLLNGRRLPTPRQTGVILLLIFLFPPLYTHLHLGQFSLLFVSLMVMLVFFDHEHALDVQKHGWMALIIVLAAAKPQFILLIYPCILAVTFQRLKWRGVLRLLGQSLCWLAACLAPLSVFSPGWLEKFIQVTFYNLSAGWALPTVFIQLTLHLGKTGLALWFFLFLSALVLSLYLWLKKGARTGLVWSMALTPLVTPYCWSWDFVLFFPLIFWSFLNHRSAWSRGVLIGGIFLANILQIIPRWGDTDLADIRQWWVPPVLLCVSVFSMLVEHWGTPRRPVFLLATPVKEEPQ